MTVIFKCKGCGLHDTGDEFIVADHKTPCCPSCGSVEVYPLSVEDSIPEGQHPDPEKLMDMRVGDLIQHMLESMYEHNAKAINLKITTPDDPSKGHLDLTLRVCPKEDTTDDDSV